MKILIFNPKYTRGKVYKKYLVLFACISFACNIVSCNGNHSQLLSVSDSLTYLYLNNTAANPELKNLLDSARYRVTFQFYHDSTGRLNLCAWRMRDTTGTFHTGGKLLHETAVGALNIAGINISLGNIHIGRNGRDSLYNSINKPGFEYIVFVPRQRVDRAKGVNNVVYDIYKSSAPPTPEHPFVPIPANMITSVGDPSPPYNAI